MGMLELLEDGPKMRKMPQVMDALLAEDRWITIHPHGDYEDYRRIEIDEEGNILKGGAVALQGTNIKDFSKNMSNKTRVKGMSFKTEEEYRKTEKSLNDRLKQAKEAQSRNEFEEAEKISKGHRPSLIQRTTDKNKTSEWLDLTTHHKDMLDKLDQFSKENKETARNFYDTQNKKEEEEYTKVQNREFNEAREQRIKENPLKNEKMERDVDKFNEVTTEKFKVLKKDVDDMRETFRKEEESIREVLNKKDVKDLTDKELKDLTSRCIKVESDANKVLEKFHNLKQESHNKFREITQSKTKNQGRYNHYLKNLKYGTDLGDFAFNTNPVNFPDDVRTKSGVSVYNMLIHERNRRWKAER